MVLFQTFESEIHYGKQAKTGGGGFARPDHPGTPLEIPDLVPYMHFRTASAQVDHAARLQAESHRVRSSWF